jgi:YegS/Rv2252/BmrU family lipid kinase
MKTVIIRNPISGSPQRQFVFARAEETFARAGCDVTVWVTERKGHARDLAEKAALEGYKCVVVAGGDGTIGQAVDGLLHSRVEDVQFGVIPMGTGNVFAREMGLPFPKSPIDDAPARAAHIIIENEPVRVDVGQANGHSFLCWAGVGLDAVIAERVESQLTFKPRAPLISYALTALNRTLSYSPAAMTLRLDDGETLNGKFPLVIVSNIRLYARYFRLTPGAKIDDGMLDLLIFTSTPKIKLLYDAAQLILSPDGQTPGMIRRQVRQVTIAADPPQPYHLDGDPLGRTPLDIRSLHRRLLIRLDRPRIADALLENAKGKKEEPHV